MILIKKSPLILVQMATALCNSLYKLALLLPLDSFTTINWSEFLDEVELVIHRKIVTNVNFFAPLRQLQFMLQSIRHLLPIAYVVWGKVMFWHVSVHPDIHSSVCLSMKGGGVPKPGPARGGGPQPGQARAVPHLGYTPHQTWPGGTMLRGCPPWIPPSDLAMGYPCQGVFHLRYPLSDLARGYPCWGVPHLGYPHGQTWLPPGQGGTPPRVIDGVLDTPRAVCLLQKDVLVEKKLWPNPEIESEIDVFSLISKLNMKPISIRLPVLHADLRKRCPFGRRTQVSFTSSQTESICVKTSFLFLNLKFV